MPGSTTNFNFPYPLDTDPLADGAQEIQNLAEDLDTTLVDLKGGTTDQLLAKNSNTDMDFKWVAAPGGYGIGYRSTWYYRSFGSGNTSTRSTGADTTFYTPFIVSETATFDRIAVLTGNTHTGTSTVRLGIYNSSAGIPTTVLIDGGTVSCTAANTYYTVTISQSLTAGMYWIAVNVQNNTGTANFVTTGTDNVWLIPGVIAGSAANTPNFTANPNMYYAETGITGAFATAGTLALESNPIIGGLRKS